MGDRTNQSVLGDEWLKNCTLFRLNPVAFLDKKKLTREGFCLDVLKDLYLDRTDIRCKVSLLSILEDVSSQFITDINLLEQIIGSLTSLYNLLGEKPDKKLLKCQILITVTSILLTSNLSCDISNMILNLKTFLLDIVLTASEEYAVLASACKCLEEIQNFFPNMLESDFSKILNASKHHMSPAFQNYVALVTLCTKNFTEISKKNSVSKRNIFREHQEENLLLTLMVYIQEVLPFMSKMTFYKVLKDLICIVKNSKKLLSSVFKFFLPSLIMSADALLIHLAFDLLREFDLEFSAQEKQVLLKQLVHLSTHPCLTSHHKLLFSDWLKCFLIKNDEFSNVFPQFHLLLPGPFDGPITQEKKACIFALCCPKSIHKNLMTVFLSESISGLKKCALLPGGTKAAASFFRTLYLYYLHHNDQFMDEYLYKLLISIMKTSPHLTPYALNFLHCVKKNDKRSFSNNILSHLVEHILSIPMKQFSGNLEYYLEILESASKETGPVCKPRSVLKLLQKVLNDPSLCKKNTWHLGNNILSVCRSLLENHDIQVFYYDLAEVLCLVTLNLDDVDVRDRAKIYYSMITTLSKIKIQSILTLQSNENGRKNPLTSFVHGGNSNLQFAFQIQKLSEPVFQLIRIEKPCETYVGNENGSTIPGSNKNVLETYQKHLEIHQSVVTLAFNLKLVKDVDPKFYNLYGIIISTESVPSCREVSVIEVPVFRGMDSDNSDVLVKLNLLPVQPCPITLNFKAEFTCGNGQSYSCHLLPVSLNFEDLILPLPIPELLKNQKLVLFESLWEGFLNEIAENGAEAKCCQSAFSLEMKKKNFQNFIEKKWGLYIVSKLSDFKYYLSMHLPPNCHLLMKASIVNEKPFLNLIVDDVSMLPWTSLFLHEINKDVVFE